ncbi:hypothetical protein ACEZ3G_07875 [Maribacter algicola]|uniref:Uncharacterized protein n=1 Tax=Meishania litoralis TaxID=3434685 RepID=A0ACC7LIP1_9FLAO
MRRAALVLTLFLSFGAILKAQDKEGTISEGDIVVLAQTAGSNYRYIHFPRKNFIIKRGAIANFNELVGKKLIVAQIETDKDGNLNATLRRKDGHNFFRFYPTVKAEISKALQNGELRMKG